MTLFESAENYLERILMLEEKREIVRAVDLANDMNFTKPSVSVALKNLRESGLVSVGEGGRLELTDDGRVEAQRVYERHMVIAQLLMGLGVPEGDAFADACRIEHDICDETFACLKEHLKQHIPKTAPEK
ncbi:MAG: metal-dependent transcriptional regulator [Oscillospiraceae bacterium]